MRNSVRVGIIAFVVLAFFLLTGIIGFIQFLLIGFIVSFFVVKFYNLESLEIIGASNDTIRKGLKEKFGFELSKCHSGFDLSLIAIDGVAQKIAIKEAYGAIKIFDYSAIMGIEILEDANSIFNKSSGGIVGRAVVGAVLAGGVGALIGGGTSQSNQTRLVKEINLKITVRDAINPNSIVNFLNVVKQTGGGIQTADTDSTMYKSAYKNAIEWKDTLSVIMDSVSNQANVELASNNPNDIASQLEKLHELKEKGILTEAEYIFQKNKLF